LQKKEKKRKRKKERETIVNKFV